MKRLLLLVQAMIMALCVGATEGDGFRLANAQDVVMYQVNPRVFAPHNSLRAVAARAENLPHPLFGKGRCKKLPLHRRLLADSR